MDASLRYWSNLSIVGNRVFQSYQIPGSLDVADIDANYDYVPVYLRHGTILRTIQYCAIWRTRLLGYVVHFLRTKVWPNRQQDKEEHR